MGALGDKAAKHKAGATSFMQKRQSAAEPKSSAAVGDSFFAAAASFFEQGLRTAVPPPYELPDPVSLFELFETGRTPDPVSLFELFETGRTQERPVPPRPTNPFDGFASAGAQRNAVRLQGFFPGVFSAAQEY